MNKYKDLNNFQIIRKKIISKVKNFYEWVVYKLKADIYFESNVDSFCKKYAQKNKLRVLLVYNRVHHHMAEFVNIALRKRFDKVEIIGCGPNNEFHIADLPNSHSKISFLAKRLNIDVLWEIESGYVSKDFQFLRSFGEINALKIWWVNDSHQFLDLMVKKSPYFDKVFVSMKDHVKSFGSKASWMPGAAPEVAIDYHLPRKHDISFVGSLDDTHSLRMITLNRLKLDFPTINIKNNIFLEEMARVYSATKIVFNMSLNGDLNYRVFEAMSCGAMLITDRINNGLLDLFQEDKDLVLYDSYTDLQEKITYYLKNNIEREKIAESGQRKIRLLHTVDHRVKEILDEITTLISKQ